MCPICYATKNRLLYRESVDYFPHAVDTIWKNCLFLLDALGCLCGNQNFALLYFHSTTTVGCLWPRCVIAQ